LSFIKRSDEMLKQDFGLSPNGDIIIEENNIKIISGRSVYIQAFRQIFRTRLTEYFLNLEEGFDFNVFLGKREIDEDEAMAALQAVGEQIEDFVKFMNITYDFNQRDRKLKIKFNALFRDNNQEEMEVSVDV